MNLLSLKTIKEEDLKLAQEIKAPSVLLPTFGVNKDFAQPEIRVDVQGYHYVIIERGTELKHQIVRDIDELFYLTFKDITFPWHVIMNLITGSKDKILDEFSFQNN